MSELESLMPSMQRARKRASSQERKFFVILIAHAKEEQEERCLTRAWLWAKCARSYNASDRRSSLVLCVHIYTYCIFRAVALAFAYTLDVNEMPFARGKRVFGMTKMTEM
jgi:hypothetical protein